MINPFDPIGTLTAFFQGVAATFDSWYTSAVKATIAFLMSSSLPSQKDVNSDFFKLNFGGTIGLALYIVSAIALLVLLVFFLTPRRDHSIRVSRFISSIVGLVLYAVLFFRLYSYVDNASKGIMQATLNFITNSQNGNVDQINNMLDASTPSGVGSVVVLGVFSVIFCWFAASLAFTFKLVVIVILIAYPVLIVIRPLGSLAVAAFNAANSLLIVAILSPIIMTWAIALPLAARNIIPGADALGITALLTLVGSSGALIAPLVLLYVFFRLSSQVFGHVDVSGQTAITEMPPLSWDEAQKDMLDNRTSPVKDVFSGVIGSSFSEGGGGFAGLIDAIPDTLVTAGAAAASAEFGPIAGAAIKFAHSKVKESVAASREAAAESEYVPPAEVSVPYNPGPQEGDFSE